MPDTHVSTSAVFSSLETVEVAPPGSPRRYTLAVLSFRQRAAFQRDLRLDGFRRSEAAVMLSVLREVMRQLGPVNLAEVLGHIDEFEAAPDNPGAKARLAAIEHAARGVAAYRDMVEANIAYDEEYAWRSVAICLRGWSGRGLPPFVRDGARAPDDLLEAIPAHEFVALATRADSLIWLGRRAEGNFVPPSTSPETPPISTAA